MPRRSPWAACRAGRRSRTTFFAWPGRAWTPRSSVRSTTRLRIAPGKLAYWAAGLAQFSATAGTAGSARLEQTYRCGFFLASRVRNYGGDLEIASGSSLRRRFRSGSVRRFQSPALRLVHVRRGLRHVQRMQGVGNLFRVLRRDHDRRIFKWTANTPAARPRGWRLHPTRSRC